MISGENIVVGVILLWVSVFFFGAAIYYWWKDRENN